MNSKGLTEQLKRFWKFFWYDDSIWSWLLNVVVAFVVIKFLVFPGLGFAFNTSHPVVAVISESMEHRGQAFDEYWQRGGPWYEANNITKAEFEEFPFRNGFNKGDIMVVYGKDLEDIEVGDVLIFTSRQPNPIIHRVVDRWQEDGTWYYQTKGDNYWTNPQSISAPNVDEMRIHEDRVIGVATLRVPLLGYVKIAAVQVLSSFGINIA